METLRNDLGHTTFDSDSGIATITLHMKGRANVMNQAFQEALGDSVTWAISQKGLRGVILATGHRDFCVGGDLEMLYGLTEPADFIDNFRALNKSLRDLETAGVPVVAALTGSALGGGYEVALAAHHRIAVDSPKVMFGLLEVSLGLFPGGGGTQRLPRLIGIQPALEVIAGPENGVDRRPCTRR